MGCGKQCDVTSSGVWRAVGVVNRGCDNKWDMANRGCDKQWVWQLVSVTRSGCGHVVGVTCSGMVLCHYSQHDYISCLAFPATSGFFTSRPALKGYIRKLSSLLQTCKQLEAFAQILQIKRLTSASSRRLSEYQTRLICHWGVI